MNFFISARKKRYGTVRLINRSYPLYRDCFEDVVKNTADEDGDYSKYYRRTKTNRKNYRIRNDIYRRW